MLFRTQSAAVYGINADLVDIEVDLAPARGESDSPSSVTIVGLPDAAVRESRERIRAAISNCGFFFPFHKTTINLAPADVRKEGASFDLPIALGILGANGDLDDAEHLTEMISVGELSLDGRAHIGERGAPEAYASLRAELSLGPERSAEILPRYPMMNEAACRALNEHWQIELAASPEARATFDKLLADSTAWLRTRRG